MATIVGIWTTLAIVLVCIIQLTKASPAVKRDLIEGKEFLSLFIDSVDDERENHMNINFPENLTEIMRSIDTINNTSTREHEATNQKPISYIENVKNLDGLKRISKYMTIQTHPKNIRMHENDAAEAATAALRKESKETAIHSTPKNVSQVVSVKVSTSNSRNLSQISIKNDKRMPHTSELHITNRLPKSISTKDNCETIDSENAESSNVDTVMLPFVDPNNDPSSTQTELQPQSTDSLLENPTVKTEKMLPLQTIIYHDSNPHQVSSGMAQGRSFSYSSIAQTVEQLPQWGDFGSLLKPKVNNSMDSSNEKLVQPKSKSLPSPENYSQPSKVYGQPSKFYSEPSKFYSQPAKVYGEPEKQYGEPSKVYSEPSKIYSEPSKIYSEPAKVYGKPSQAYWPQPHQPLASAPEFGDRKPTLDPNFTATTTKQPESNRKVIFNLDKLPYDLLNAPEAAKKLLQPDVVGKLPDYSVESQKKTISRIFFPPTRPPTSTKVDQPSETVGVQSAIDNPALVRTDKPSKNEYQFEEIGATEDPESIYVPTHEQNYEIEEAVSVMTNGRAHGVQSHHRQQTTLPTTTEDPKTGYVVEGRNFRKYRVEEKTSDGFIVGEYGVVSHNDGSLRGVRYTADSNINPGLIQQALMKFLSL